MTHVTHEALRRASACAVGVKDFLAVFPYGLDVTDWTAAQQIGVLMHADLRRWLGWAWENLSLPRHDMARWDLRRENLTETDLRGANLGEANLRGANLAGARPPKGVRFKGWRRGSGGLLERC